MSGSDKIPTSEITPASVYFSRRTFMRAGVLAASAVATGGLYRVLTRRPYIPPPPQALTEELVESEVADPVAAGFRVAEPKTPLNDVISYNNFYEFSTSKGAVAEAAADFKTTGWQIAVGGLVSKPQTFSMDDLKKVSRSEERIYRMRCVEGWSMVIPWAGFSLSKLLKKVDPLSSAKYVAFETLHDPKRMPNQESGVLDWPYVEGLRMDEAMHPLTLLATGLYGREMPPQNGAPVRLVIPWKYGFKGIKSIVRITLTDKEPPTTWNLAAPHEYGFYANVNPSVPHPRWSQATEERIGPGERRPTLLFNGYGEQVASLYKDMDLRVHF